MKIVDCFYRMLSFPYLRVLRLPHPSALILALSGPNRTSCHPSNPDLYLPSYQSLLMKKEGKSKASHSSTREPFSLNTDPWVLQLNELFDIMYSGTEDLTEKQSVSGLLRSYSTNR